MKSKLSIIFIKLCLFAIISVNYAGFIDLTHSVDENTIYWPTGSPFNFTKKFANFTDQGIFYSANEFSTPEHLGTHIDAPYHFCESCATVDQIPIENFVTNGILIDISEKCKNNPDYLMTADDLKLSKEDLEYLKGKKNFAIIHTGWGLHWSNRTKYLGTDDNDVTKLRFPGIGESGAKSIVDSKLFVGIGIDTASTDFGQSTTFITHQVLAHASVYSIENVANSHLLPKKNFNVYVFPMKIKGGTGGPVRLVAHLIDTNDKWQKFTEL